MEWQVAVVTYNVGLQTCTWENVEKLCEGFLDQKSSLVAIGLQEVPHLEAAGVKGSSWTSLITEWMILRGQMTMLTKTYQATNVLMVFIQHNLVLYINSISYRYNRNTLKGLTGHKGSISIRLTLNNDLSIVFVNSHLCHGVENNLRRIEQCISNKYCCFNDYKSIFWFGDLNFRLNGDERKVEKLINAKAFPELLENFDQLNVARRQKNLLEGFSEPEIHFQPSYKYTIGSSNFNWSRLPAWCDRILHKGSNLSPISYSMNESVKCSDHKPVASIYRMNIGSIGPYHCNVLFEHIRYWYSNIPFISRMEYLNDFWKLHGSYSDWIGVYPSDFQNIEAPIKWVWAYTCFEQCIQQKKIYVCEFSNLPEGTYRLGYFSSSRNCLIGVSKSFTINSIQK
ncbi:unnamed protein product [Auanema sp. JU1783]|nr:unnamed protein product [Auanema sp. JU1783]